jgi:hypothetical protein
MKSMSLFRRQARYFGVGDVVSVREALNQAHFEEMELDPNVTIFIFMFENKRIKKQNRMFPKDFLYRTFFLIFDFFLLFFSINSKKNSVYLKNIFLVINWLISRCI